MKTRAESQRGPTPPVARLLAIGCALALGAAGCRDARAEHRGVVRIDGSSTVFPLLEALAEEGRGDRLRVAVGVSGTGGGFDKLCGGGVDITGASRAIRPEEAKRCEAQGISFVEVPIALDGVTVVVHRDNHWVDHLDLPTLKTMWAPEAQETRATWASVRSDWPSRPLRLFGPGTVSGTYDSFAAAVIGPERGTRGDFTSSEDDNVLVRGVITDPQALGFFGYAYARAHRDRLRIVPIDGGDGPVTPSAATIADGSYAPLGRPLFLYVNTAALSRGEVRRFAERALARAPRLCPDLEMVPLSENGYRASRARLAARTTGSAYAGRRWTSAEMVKNVLGRDR